MPTVGFEPTLSTGEKLQKYYYYYYYIGCMFRLWISHLQAYFCHLNHGMLCTLWDPIVFTSMECIGLNHLSS